MNWASLVSWLLYEANSGLCTPCC